MVLGADRRAVRIASGGRRAHTDKAAARQGRPKDSSERRVGVRSALVALLACACQPEPWDADLPEPTPVGEHLRFWTDAEEDDFCDGSLAYLDAYTAELKQIHEVPDDVRVDYFRYAEDPDDVHVTCDPSAVACAIEGSVFTPLLRDEHERRSISPAGRPAWSGLATGRCRSS